MFSDHRSFWSVWIILYLDRKFFSVRILEPKVASGTAKLRVNRFSHLTTTFFKSSNLFHFLMENCSVRWDRTQVWLLGGGGSIVLATWPIPISKVLNFKFVSFLMGKLFRLLGSNPGLFAFESIALATWPSVPLSLAVHYQRIFWSHLSLLYRSRASSSYSSNPVGIKFLKMGERLKMRKKNHVCWEEDLVNKNVNLLILWTV